MGVLSVILTDLAFNPLAGQDGPILANVDGDIVLTSIDSFPAHKITLMGSDARAIRSIDPTILPCGCIITEEGMGEVARGYIEDPQAQINDAGHTITLSIPNVTEGLRWDTTGPGWTAAAGLDTIVGRIASRSPPWKASIIDTGAPVLSVYPVTWFNNDPTTSDAELNALTKHGDVAYGWNVGAMTKESFASGDGAISSVAFGSNTARIFGFTSNFNTYSYEMINHGISLNINPASIKTPTSGVLSVYENGFLKYQGANSSYYPGDLLAVSIVNGVVQYSINNLVFYTSTLAPSYPCYGACSLHSPNAAIIGAMMSSYVAPKDVHYAISFENATVLDGLLQVSQRTYRHIRQKQVNGVPVRELEVGLFNAPPTMILKTADGESPTQVAARNQYTRLIQPQADYSYQTSQIVTIGAAFGGGNGDTQVNLRDLYDYLHPPVGSAPPSTGPQNQFPEYDDQNFPIERRVALNGTYYYVVKNAALIAKMLAKGHHNGEIWGAIDDSSIVYVDHSADAQRQTVQRALYVSCVTKLKRHASLHFTAAFSTEGRGRVTQAGDQVNVQITRTGRQLVGGVPRAFTEANINVSPIVTEVIRKYQEASITDDWKVSTLGRLLTDDAAALGDTLRGLEAVRLVPTTSGQTVVIGPIEQTINSVFPLDIPVSLPNTMYRMTAASLKVTLKPARHNVRLTQGAQLDGKHDHAVTIPPLTVNIFPLPGHTHTGVVPYHAHGSIHGYLTTTGGTDISHGQGTSTYANRFGSAYRSGGVSRSGGVGRGGSVGRYGNVNRSGGVGRGGSVTKSGSAKKTGTSQNSANLSNNGQHGHLIPVFSGTDPTGTGGAPGRQGIWFNYNTAAFNSAAGSSNGPSTGSQTFDTAHSHSDGIGVSDLISVLDGLSVDDRLAILDALGISDNISIQDLLNILDQLGIIDGIGVGGGGNVGDLYNLIKSILNGSTGINFDTDFYSAYSPTLNDNGGNLIGMTTIQNLITSGSGGVALNGSHTHNLFPDIQETNLGGSFQVWINSGDGVYVDRSPELGGPWTASMEIKGNVSVAGTGMERFLQAPGKSVGIRVVAINSAGNPTGICNVQVSGTWEFEKSAISSTIFAGTP